MKNSVFGEAEGMFQSQKNKVVQSIMGHQHYSTTIDIYTHVTDEKYQDEIRKFGRAMEQVGQEEVEANGGMTQILQ